MLNRLAAPVLYRVDVSATGVAEAVRCAGGWIFDHAMGGWAVNVSVPEIDDARPLQILGATVSESVDLPHPAQQMILRTRGAADAEPILHRLSAAARLFKSHALLAAGLSPSVDDYETLWDNVAAYPGLTGAKRAEDITLKTSGAQVLTP